MIAAACVFFAAAGAVCWWAWRNLPTTDFDLHCDEALLLAAEVSGDFRLWQMEMER